MHGEGDDSGSVLRFFFHRNFCDPPLEAQGLCSVQFFGLGTPVCLRNRRFCRDSRCTVKETTAVLCCGFFSPELLRSEEEQKKTLLLIDLYQSGRHSLQSDVRQHV